MENFNIIRIKRILNLGFEGTVVAEGNVECKKLIEAECKGKQLMHVNYDTFDLHIENDYLVSAPCKYVIEEINVFIPDFDSEPIHTFIRNIPPLEALKLFNINVSQQKISSEIIFTDPKYYVISKYGKDSEEYVRAFGSEEEKFQLQINTIYGYNKCDLYSEVRNYCGIEAFRRHQKNIPTKWTDESVLNIA